MSSSKSTVVGVRLDHDRRAWVEAEAGRRGITIRVLFEEFIDRARNAETADTPALRSLSDGEPPPIAGSTAASRPWPCSELTQIPGLPGVALRTACAVTLTLVRAGGGCVLRRLSRGDGGPDARRSRGSAASA